MHLPVRTYNTAVVYLHKFRLVHPENSGFIDAAAAALFTACKIEDTLKKSRDILCAAHNVKLAASEQVTPDDPLFENHAKIIIGVERLMLEASGFDFRNRYPQRLLLKIAKVYGVDRATIGKIAYNMSLDLYRTFAPLKQTTSTMAIACVELAGRVHDQPVAELEAGKDYEKWQTTRQEIMETLLDLLDLYTHHRASTIVGQDYVLEKFISMRIALNQEASAEDAPRFIQSNRKNGLTNGTNSNGVKETSSPREITTPKDVKSPQPLGLTSVTGTPVQGKPGLKEGTVRFMLDPERARDEKHTVADFFKMEEEEYEVEVENDRRRDSAISMTFLAGEDSDATCPPKMESQQEEVDIDRFLDNISQETVGMSSVDQENYPKILADDCATVIQSHPSTLRPRVPLTEQGIAFQAALQQSHAGSSHMRGARQIKKSKAQETHRAGAPSASKGKGNADAAKRRVQEKMEQRKLRRQKERERKKQVQISSQTEQVLPTQQSSQIEQVLPTQQNIGLTGSVQITGVFDQNGGMVTVRYGG
ncbi:MAG: hypothetical protein LQ350_006104 [Teloschistes chrysophthalmus]|nr:MAG: hypothetical protein LQ350_006104 [Niorma chrysophthalma]